jgi:hypothetical protein
VAAHALGRQPLAIELTDGSRSVAGVTIRYGMGANQWKTILMLVDGVNGHLPSVHAVTEVALRSVFSPMNVGMTILAVAPHVGENGVDVALLAGHLAVHAAQGIAGFAMIKLGVAADRLPGRAGMSLFTSNIKRTMGTLTRRRGFVLLYRRRGDGQLKEQERMQ